MGGFIFRASGTSLAACRARLATWEPPGSLEFVLLGWGLLEALQVFRPMWPLCPPSAYSLVANAADTLSELEMGDSLAFFGAGEVGGCSSAAVAGIASSVQGMGSCPVDLCPSIAAEEIHVCADYHGAPRTCVPLVEKRIS